MDLVVRHRLHNAVIQIGAAAGGVPDRVGGVEQQRLSAVADPDTVVVRVGCLHRVGEDQAGSGAARRVVRGSDHAA